MKIRKGSLYPELEFALSFIEGSEECIDKKINQGALESEEPESLDVLSRYFIATDQTDLAFRCLDAIEARLGKDAHIASRKASLYFSLGQIKNANAEYVRFIESFSNNPGIEEFWRPFKKAAADLEKAIQNDQMQLQYNEEYWDDKDKVHTNWQLYLDEFKDSHRYSGTGSQINAALTNGISQCIDEDKEISLAMNIGSFCGYHDLHRAKAFPACKWIGYDRESIAISLNKEQFQAPNLAFADGEFEEAIARDLKKTGAGTRLICHVRAATEMPPAVVEKIYNAAARNGVEWIVGAEWFGPNPLTKEYFDESRGGIVSEIISLQTLNHPYERMLNDAGYELIEIHDEPLVAYDKMTTIFPSSGFFASQVIRTFRARLT